MILLLKCSSPQLRTSGEGARPLFFFKELTTGTLTILQYSHWTCIFLRAYLGTLGSVIRVHKVKFPNNQQNIALGKTKNSVGMLDGLGPVFKGLVMNEQK